MLFLHHRGWHYLLLILIGALVFFLNLGGPTLWDVDEGRNSPCSFTMLLSGDWIVPTFNGELRVDKPVLLYWLQMLSYLCFGVNEFAARFPSAVAAFVTVLVSYELARSMFSRTTGLLAGVIVATTPMMCGAGRFANPDALLNCFTVLTLTIFWLGLAERRWWWFLAIGVSAGFAALAKGPVGFVLPGAVCTLFILWERQWRLWLDRRWMLTVVSFILVAVPWYVLVGMETHGKFLSGFFFKHNLDRALAPMENHNGFPGYYLVVLLIGTAPWSIFLGMAWWYGFWSAIRQPWARWQSAWTKRAEPETPAAYRLLACWIIVYVLVFSIAATKLPNYVLPVVVPSAILIARFLQRWRTQAVQLPAWFAHAGVVTLLLIGILVAVGLTVAGGRSIHGLENWALLGVIPMAAAGLCWWFSRRQQYGRFIAVVAVAALALLAPLAAFGSVVFNSYKAPRSLVEQAHALNRTDDIRIGGWRLEHLPSLNFYVQRDIEHLKEEKDIAGFLGYRVPVFLFMPLEDWQRLKGSLNGVGRVVGQHPDMYHHQDIVVVTNR